MSITARIATLGSGFTFRPQALVAIPTGPTGARQGFGHTEVMVIMPAAGGHLMCLASVPLITTTTCGGTTIGATATTITTDLHDMDTTPPAMKSGA